jgi:hypothetical protein
LAVASFVNPHDIAFAGGLYELLIGRDASDGTVPDVDEAPSQSDSFVGRPSCQEQFTKIWPQAIAPQATDLSYRKLYYYLHKIVDQAIGRILDALESSGMADDTIVVFTSDHGDLLGAHGGLQQKWCNAFDEATRVPLLVRGPGITARPEGISTPTSHVDLIPTLMGLAGIDVEQATHAVAAHHTEARPLPGRDLSRLLLGAASVESVAAPVYFMTEDDVTRGLNQTNVLTGTPFEAVEHPSNIESVITTLPTGAGGEPELWKLNHYYQRLDEWNTAQGLPPNPFAGPAAEPDYELHNLTVDPEERHNCAADNTTELSQLKSILETQRDQKRLVPSLRNP